MSWFGLATLTIAHAGAGELAGAGDHRVGAFHRLDGDDGRRLHRDRLADVEAGDRRRPSDSRTRGPPAPRRSARARVSTPARASSGVEERGRVEQLDAVVAQHVGDRGDERVGVPRLAAASARRAASGRARCPAKSLVCLTCPAITACVTPASFSSADALARAGRARSSGSPPPAAARPRRRARERPLP